MQALFTIFQSAFSFISASALRIAIASVATGSIVAGLSALPSHRERQPNYQDTKCFAAMAAAKRVALKNELEKKLVGPTDFWEQAIFELAKMQATAEVYASICHQDRNGVDPAMIDYFEKMRDVVDAWQDQFGSLPEQIQELLFAGAQDVLFGGDYNSPTPNFDAAMITMIVTVLFQAGVSAVAQQTAQEAFDALRPQFVAKYGEERAGYLMDLLGDKAFTMDLSRACKIDDSPIIVYPPSEPAKPAKPVAGPEAEADKPVSPPVDTDEREPETKPTPAVPSGHGANDAKLCDRLLRQYADHISRGNFAAASVLLGEDAMKSSTTSFADAFTAQGLASLQERARQSGVPASQTASPASAFLACRYAVQFASALPYPAPTISAISSAGENELEGALEWKVGRVNLKERVRFKVNAYGGFVIGSLSDRQVN